MRGWRRTTVAAVLAGSIGCVDVGQDTPPSNVPAPRRSVWVYPWTFINGARIKVWDPFKLEVQAQVAAIDVFELRCKISERLSTYFDEPGLDIEGFNRNGDFVLMGDNFYAGEADKPATGAAERHNWNVVSRLTADARNKLIGRGDGLNLFYTDRITVLFGPEPPGVSQMGNPYSVVVPHHESDFPPDSPYRLIAAHEIGHQLNLPNSNETGNLMSGLSFIGTDLTGAIPDGGPEPPSNTQCGTARKWGRDQGYFEPFA